MQLYCVSDWPLHALSWQQSEGGSPGLPAPLNQKASAAPLYCMSTKSDLLCLLIYILLKLPCDLSCPLVAPTNRWTPASVPSLLLLYFHIRGDVLIPHSFPHLFLLFFFLFVKADSRTGCWLPLSIPFFIFLSSCIYPLQTNTCAALLSQTTLSLPS